MQLNIKIVSLDTELKTAKNGKTYKALTVVYKGPSNKIETKTINPFGPSQRTVEILSEATPGQTYEVEAVKNDAGYWDWVNPRLSDGASASPMEAAPRPTGGRTATPEPSRFETPEERAKKQVYIVRQSSISAAVASLSVGSKAALDPQKVIETAKQYEAYVFDTEYAAAEAPKAESDLPDDDIDF
jgi:hypothetical protein